MINKTMIAGLLAILMTNAVAGCGVIIGPRLIHRHEVAVQFEGYQIYPGYQYYTSGTLENPLAILAMKPGYTLDSPDWQLVNMDSQDLQRWVVALNKDFFIEENTFPNGANIIGPKGEIVGYYYSGWEFPSVNVVSEKTIKIYKPMAEYRLSNKYRMEWDE